MRVEVREQNKIIIEPISNKSCIYCKSQNIKKFGIRKNKSGDIQRFKCVDCSKTFSINAGFEKVRTDSKMVAQTLQLYFSGESLRSIQKFLKQQSIKVDHSTIYKWIVKYTTLLKKYLDKITPQVGDAWRADEIWIKIRGELKYVFALMDDETRFWIAQQQL